MTVEVQNYAPCTANLTLACNGTSAAQSQITQGTNPAEKLTQARIFNESGATAFVAFQRSGTATATASGVNSIPISAGTTEVLNVGPATTVSAILGTNTATGNVYVSMGNGS